MRKLIAATALSLLGLVAVAPMAHAKTGDVRAAGTCSVRSASKIKLAERDEGLKIEFEVDENVVGATWRVTITDNGTRVLGRRYTTVAPSGSFTARAVVPNAAGADVVVARATNLVTGETCRASARIG
jgi:hypothetical protein